MFLNINESIIEIFLPQSKQQSPSHITGSSTGVALADSELGREGPGVIGTAGADAAAFCGGSTGGGAGISAPAGSKAKRSVYRCRASE